MKPISLLVSLILALLILGGCTTAHKITAVRMDMTRADVISAMGEPASTGATDGKEFLNYKLLESAWDWEPTPYTVIIREGKVVSYGRQNQIH